MIRAWSCGRDRVQGGVRLGRLKRPGGDRGGAQRDKDPGVLAGDLGALFRGGEEGKGKREPLTGGAVLVSGGERVARALTGGVGRARRERGAAGGWDRQVGWARRVACGPGTQRLRGTRVRRCAGRVRGGAGRWGQA